MNWEAWTAIGTVLGAVIMAFGQWGFKRLPNQTTVRGHISTKEQAEPITGKELGAALAGFAANEKVNQVKTELENRIDDAEDQLGHKLDTRMNEIEARVDAIEMRTSDKIEQKFNQAISRNDESARRLHGRMDGLSSQLSEVIGLLKGKGENL